MRPAPGTYPPYYGNYIPLVSEDNILEALENGTQHVVHAFSKVSPQLAQFAYAEGKWTIAQLYSHIIDTERIMSYRALRFARRDPEKPLSFDEDHYAANAGTTARTLASLTEEFLAVRKATIQLFRHFDDATLACRGITGAGETDVLSIGYMICGHALHHCNVLGSRYKIN